MDNDLPGMDELLEADRAAFEASQPDLSALFARVAAETVDHEPTVRDRLREQTTGVRVGLATAAVLVLGGGFLVASGLRQDLDGASLTRLLATMAGLVVVAVAAIRFSLRALAERPLGPGGWAMGAIALLLPIGLALVPWEGQHVPADKATAAMIKCGVAGMVFAAWTAGAVVLFDRGDRTSTWRFALAAGAGGLVGFVFTGLHCAAVDLPHMVFGHGLSGVLVALAVLALRSLRRR